MNCGYCKQRITSTATAQQPFGPMHIRCWHKANDLGLLKRFDARFALIVMPILGWIFLGAVFLKVCQVLKP